MGRLVSGEKQANKLPRRGAFSSAAGSLFVEAAITLPVVFIALLGTIEVLNLYVQRASIVNVANSIAMAIQQKPNITAQEMYEFQKSLGGGLTPFAEVNVSDGLPYTGTTPCSAKDCRVAGLEIRIGGSANPVKEHEIRDLAPSDWSTPHVGKKAGNNIWGSSRGEGNPAWPNSSSPFVADPNQDGADDGQPYYVGVRVAWKNRPVFNTPWFASVAMTQFAGVLVKPTLGCQDSGTLCGAGFIENSPSGGLYIRGVEGGLASRDCKGVKLIDENSIKRISLTRSGGYVNAATTSSVVNCPAGYSGVLVGYATFPNNFESAQYLHYSCASNGSTCAAGPAPVPTPSLPEQQGLKKVFGGSTGNIVGVKAINAALEQGIQVGWGSGNEADKGNNRAFCELPPNPSDAQVRKLWVEPSCAHRFCNGKFNRGWDKGGNPVNVTLMGGCSIGATGGTVCETAYPNQPMVNFGCMWIDD